MDLGNFDSDMFGFKIPMRPSVPTFDPFIRYHRFNRSSIDFTGILRPQRIADNYFIKHEFINALQARYRKEIIAAPFPMRTLELKTDGPLQESLRRRSDRARALSN